MCCSLHLVHKVKGDGKFVLVKVERYYKLQFKSGIYDYTNREM